MASRLVLVPLKFVGKKLWQDPKDLERVCPGASGFFPEASHLFSAFRV